MRALLFIVMTLLVANEAFANAGTLPDTLDVLLQPGDTTGVALEATFGLLIKETGNPSWVCHETMVPTNSSATPAFFEDAAGRFFAVIGGLGIAHDINEALFRSIDGGCNWDTVGGLNSTVIWAVAFDPTSPDHSLAVSATPGASTTNGIFVSTDGGAQWNPTSVASTDILFRSIAWSPVNDQIVWASANWYSPEAAWIYKSTDGGVNWTPTDWTFAVDSEVQINVDLAAVSQTDEEIAYATVDSLAGDYLLRTTNGGTSWSEVFFTDDTIRDVEVDTSDIVWVATQTQGLWKSTNGTSFAVVANAPLVRGLASDSRGVFAATNVFSDGYAIGLATDGASFNGIFSFKTVSGPKACDAGSDVDTYCVPLWPALAQQLGISAPLIGTTLPFHDPPYPQKRKDTGGCLSIASVGGDSHVRFVGFSALLLGLLFRRRKS